jgi:3-hydroxybutyryl-CoA dehydratase
MEKLDKGDKFNKKFKIRKEIYEGFISVFKDKNPIHTDKEYATSKGFKSIVMHGNILNGFISYFIGELLPIKNIVIYKQEIKFHNPAYLDDELELNAIVSDIFDSVNVVEFKFEFSNQEGLKISSGKIQIGVI